MSERTALLAKPGLRLFLLGLAGVLLAAVLFVVFLAYQDPAWLLDWVNLAYCG